MTAQNIKECLIRNLDKFKKLSGAQAAKQRYKKFREIGEFTENAGAAPVKKTKVKGSAKPRKIKQVQEPESEIKK